jgi:hypothetical protein
MIPVNEPIILLDIEPERLDRLTVWMLRMLDGLTIADAIEPAVLSVEVRHNPECPCNDDDDDYENRCVCERLDARFSLYRRADLQ